MNDDRLYTLNTDGEDHYARYWTGRTADGRQALIGYAADSEVLVVWFGPGGELQGVQPLPLAPGECEPDGSTMRTIVRRMPGWRADLGLTPGPIRVRRFDLWEPFEVFIRDVPGELADHEAGEYGALYTPAERARLDRAAAGWRAAGDFALVWGDEEFGVRADGSPRY